MSDARPTAPAPDPGADDARPGPTPSHASRRPAWRSPAALSGLLVLGVVAAYLLVPRFGGPFGDVTTDQPLRFSSSSVVVGAGDTGTVTVGGALQGRAEGCVRVVGTSSGPGAVSFAAEVDQRLGGAGRVEVQVQEGDDIGEAAGACGRFRASRTVFEGTLADLASSRPAPLATSGPVVRTYRLVLRVDGHADGGSPVSVSALLSWRAARTSG